MKKIMVLVLGVVSIALMTGCEKKETVQAPEQPMVTDQAMAPAAGSAMTATAANEPLPAMEAPVGAASDADAANAALDQVDTIDKPTNQQIQQALKNAGLYSGQIDGSLGPKTKKAIEEFQAQSGLTADGKVGPKTWSKLGAHLTGASAVATEPIMPADESATATTSN